MSHSFLSELELALIIKVLELTLPRGEIWLFGSRVTGKNIKKFSDIDLVFKGNPPLDTNEIGLIKETFSASDLPYKVDLVNFSELPTELKIEIDKNQSFLIRR